MGDPKFPRRQYSTPFHPWKAERIAEENSLQKKYGLKNKKEVWRAKSHLRVFRQRARTLAAQLRTGNPQADKEKGQLLARLHKLGVLQPQATLDDVLTLNVEQILTRRLQTQVYLKGFCASPDQARQFIAHGHVVIGERRVNIPGYYVKRGEEERIALEAGSPLADAAHPVRPKRAEGAGPVKLKEYKPPEPRPRGGRGGPGGGRPGGPPRPPRSGAGGA